MVNVLGKLQLLGIYTVKVLSAMMNEISNPDNLLRLRDINAFFEGIESSDHFLHDPFIKKVAQNYDGLTRMLEDMITKSYQI